MDLRQLRQVTKGEVFNIGGVSGNWTPAPETEVGLVHPASGSGNTWVADRSVTCDLKQYADWTVEIRGRIVEA